MRALADRVFEREQRAADDGEVLLGLGEVVVEEVVEEVGHRAPSTARSIKPCAPRPAAPAA